MPNNVVRKDQEIDAVHWDSITAGAKLVAEWVKKTFGNKVAVYGIPRGGMIPAIMVVHQLEAMGVEARYLADIYHVQPSELHSFVIIDEICDSGDTFRALKQLFPMAKTATLFHRIGAKFIADFHSFDIKDDRWLKFPWEASNDDSQ